MFIIWKGKGIYTLVIIIASFIFVQLLAMLITQNKDIFAESDIPRLVGFITSGFSVFLIGTHLNRSVQDKHSFFFIRMEFWGIILPLIGLVDFLYHTRLLNFQ